MCVSSSFLKYFFCQVTEWLGRKYTWDRYWYCADDVDDCLCHFYLYRKSNRIHVLVAPPAGAYPPFTIASYWKSFKQQNFENSSCSQRFILLHREQFNLIVSSSYSFTWLDKPEQHLLTGIHRSEGQTDYFLMLDICTSHFTLIVLVVVHKNQYSYLCA